MKILFAVFDWGLGHATRDSPFIEGLLDEGHKVDIISTGRSLKFLKDKFRGRCGYFDVLSVSAPYTKGKFFALSFVLNFPKIYLQLKMARKISKEIIEKGNYDKVISDGRYDVYDKPENSYLIGHQLKMDLFFGVNTLAQIGLASAIKPYGTVFVLDFKNREMTGWLGTFPGWMSNVKVEPIGISSHIKKKNMKKDIDYFIPISGPEPQRTILEKKILSQIGLLKGKIVIAGGNPDSKIKKTIKNAKFYSFLNSKQQEEMMNRAKFIICRSGYTTMMEFAELDIKKALLIPTPGQKEQEGLAKIYESRRNFHYVNQDELNLGEDVKKCKNYHGLRVPWKTEESVKKFLKIFTGDRKP